MHTQESSSMVIRIGLDRGYTVFPAGLQSRTPPWNLGERAALPGDTDTIPSHFTSGIMAMSLTGALLRAYGYALTVPTTNACTLQMHAFYKRMHSNHAVDVDMMSRIHSHTVTVTDASFIKM
eukprot:1374799-Amorphochlora_amoeboformis.AAC.1